MAINQNHLFEELDGVKCAIVEKNASVERVEFLRPLLVYNGYTVVVVPSPPPKTAAAPAAGPATATTPVPTASTSATTAPGTTAVPAAAPTPAPAPVPPPPPPAPSTFTIGVTDVTFNPTNAIFGRLLRTQNGHVVTLAYWQQKEKESHDEVPYFE